MKSVGDKHITCEDQEDQDSSLSNTNNNLTDSINRETSQAEQVPQESEKLFKGAKQSPDKIINTEESKINQEQDFSLFSHQIDDTSNQNTSNNQNTVNTTTDIPCQPNTNIQNRDQLQQHRNTQGMQQQFNHMQNWESTYKQFYKNVQSKKSAFQKIQKINQSVQEQQNKASQQLVFKEEDSVFSLSENINRLLLDDSQDKPEPPKNKDKFKRSQSNILGRLTSYLLNTFQLCNPKFFYQPLEIPYKKELTLPSEGTQNMGYDNIEGDYILRMQDLIITPEGKEYEILDLMGKGTFGQVVKCISHQTKELVAIKLNRIYDPNGESPLVRMLDFFVFRDHLCIMFELLSVSVYDLIKENNFQGISLNFSRLIISQILDAMKIVKDAKLIHCDLKPENILFKSRDNLSLKIIDFGSACFEGYGIFNYIQSRYYRSPEVLLQLPYDTAIDMWSLGCIAAELFLGIPIFPGNSEYDQLAKIIEIVGMPPMHLLQKAKARDKYFIYMPEYNTYRLKTFDEYQITNGVQIDIPKRYNYLQCLDDLKKVFIEKKVFQQAQKEGKPIEQIQAPTISESEMSSMESFIDFLKGLLRIDKDQRWTPNMAKEHPFITRQMYTGPFEPQREQERISTNETGEDTVSEKSTSSKDSKEYKVGSCPSKILYPQSVQMQPQYLQQAQSSLHQQNLSGQDTVFHGSNITIQSHRPPILSIPDNYFKGFMFGRLDQILSMTREQLYQFVYEQNELMFRQNQQKQLAMHQQQYQQYLQQQQYQMFLQQQQMQQQQYQQQMPGMYIPQIHPQQQPPQQQMQLQQQPQYQSLQQNKYQQFYQPNPQAIGMNIYQPQQPMMNQQFNMAPPPNMNFPPMDMQQMQQYNNQKAMMMFPQNVQFAPSEQTIFNPPPYQQLKSQLYSNAQNINDPQFQIQQQRRNQMLKGQKEGQNNKGKAGSWHPPPGLQAHKYNQYYNQINNPGQIIGRPSQIGDPVQQQFVHQQFAHHAGGHHNKKDDNQFLDEQMNLQYQMPNQQPFTKNDFKKASKDKKHSNQQIFNQVIPEVTQPNQSYDQQQLDRQQYVPFPSNQQIFTNYPQQQQPFNQKIMKKPLDQSNQLLQFNPQNFQETFQKELQFPITPREQVQPNLSGSFVNQPFGQQKQFPSPKQQLQQHLPQQQVFSFTQAQNPQQRRQINKSQTFNQTQMPPQQQQLNDSTSLQQQQYGSYLKRFEQANPKANQSQTQGHPHPMHDKQLFNNSHYYKYQQHIIGVNNPQYSRNRSNSDINAQEEGKDGDMNQSQSQINQFYHSSSQSMGNISLGQQDSEQNSPSNMNKGKLTGFEGLQAQIKKQGLNASPYQPPHSAKGSGQSFTFEQLHDEGENNVVEKKNSMGIQINNNSTQSQVFTPKQFKKTTTAGGKGQQILRLQKNQIEQVNKTNLSVPQQYGQQLSQSSSIGDLGQQRFQDNIQNQQNQYHQNIQILGQSMQSIKGVQSQSQSQLQSKTHIIQLQTQNSGRNLTPIDETGMFGGVNIGDSSDSSQGSRSSASET